ncbi:hypothetical protein [Paracoccus sp. PAR01]|uniref:hypothetical protein n=1 Tax=Paracoccus sp. PAR01 TaxID=2769282 RepID=UPI0017811470|nr:hypothetical protein [Paracoccus sp. PAR01]MBD9529896.1 hypothetical protein [Paracoccus sp. PAR01]
MIIHYVRLVLNHLWVACLAGAAVIALLAIGFVSSETFIWAGVLGLGLGVPAALLNWAYLRTNRSRQIGWNLKIADWARHG